MAERVAVGCIVAGSIPAPPKFFKEAEANEQHSSQTRTMKPAAAKRKRHKYSPVGGRVWGTETQIQLSDLMLDAQSHIRETIRQLLTAYQQLSNGQRLIFQT